ncbi:hypothetical protein CPC08DRAFT_497245 [Agrocybe pediades]|nr:hypothetical protein CPC08DRAFT_497245 [Agrocybe pediades]
MPSTGAEQEQLSSSIGESISVGASPKKSRRSKVSSATATSLEGKMTARPPEKPFLVPPPATPSVVTILRRPVEMKSQSSTQGDGAFDSENDGGKTPTNGAEGVAGASMTIHVHDSSPPNLTGKKGKRVGRREREREKLKKDMQKEMSKEGGSEEEDSEEDEIGVNFDYVDELDAEDDSPLEESVEDQEDQGENDSISNLPLLRPPRRRHVRRRRRAADTVYIHSIFGMEQGAYKSIPASPKRLELDLEDVGEESRDFSIGNVVDKPKAQDDSEIFDARPSGRVVGEKKKRTRSRRLRSLSHAKSDPQLRQESNSTTEAGKQVDDLEITASINARKDQKTAAQQDDDIDILDMDRTQFQKLISASSATGSRMLLLNQQRKSEAPAQQTSSNTKRGRIISLARKLVQLFPEQQEELGKVIARLERQYPKQKTRGDELSNAGGVPQQQSPSTAPGLKRKKSKKKSGHARTASEGTGGEGMEYEDDSIDSGVGGFLRNMHRQPAEHDDDDEEEIDPRGRPPKKGDVLIHVFIDHSNILIGLLSHLKRHPPQRKLAGKSHHLLAGPTAKPSTSATSNATQDQASTFALVKPTRSRPLTIPTNSEAASSRSLQTHNPDTEGGSHPIALPSFATPSRSLPAAPGLASYMPPRDDSQSPDIQRHKDIESDGNDYADESADIFHPDSLIFGSSHRTKEKRIMKHLWHAALTLILERGRPITRRVVVTSSPLYQPMDTIERLGYELRVFIRVPDFGDGMDRERFRARHSSSKSNPNSGKAAQHIGSGGAFSSPQKGSHVRRISGDYSAESGSGDGSGSGGGGKGSKYSSNAPNAKIKYREQGVDELLQLKLHQALAATDYVPEGSTIVLATGDGNVGQFNEDGFLGPVRTALKRGWRVELYAWEDGLSRSWRREFGAGSEWGRRGMFRVIGMEQFANSLLEASEWST